MKLHTLSILLGSSKSNNKIGIDNAELVIKQNDKVKQINKDDAFHTITSITEKRKIDDVFNSKIIEPSEDFLFQFKNKGNFEYFDTLHPWITGKISVT